MRSRRGPRSGWRMRGSRRRKARIDAARSAYNPTFTLLGEAWLAPGARYVDYTAPAGAKIGAVFPLGNDGAFNAVTRYGLTFDVRGNVYDFGRTSAAVDAASAQRRAAQADARKLGREIVRDVRLAYVRWATSYALCAISERSAPAAVERAKLVEASIQEGARRTADRTSAASDAGFARLELEPRARTSRARGRTSASWRWSTSGPRRAPPPTCSTWGHRPRN